MRVHKFTANPKYFRWLLSTPGQYFNHLLNIASNNKTTSVKPQPYTGRKHKRSATDTQMWLKHPALPAVTN
jgi:hypothetical protein